jgi:hypothetical protein
MKEKFYTVLHDSIGSNLSKGDTVSGTALGDSAGRLLTIGAISEVAFSAPELEEETEGLTAYEMIPSDISSLTVPDLKAIAVSLDISPTPTTKHGLMKAIQLEREKRSPKPVDDGLVLSPSQIAAVDALKAALNTPATTVIENSLKVEDASPIPEGQSGALTVEDLGVVSS